MTDKQIKKYISNGGKQFRVSVIDTFRDGGTVVISTNIGKIYIDKDYTKIYSDYPLRDENLITDALTIKYIIHRIRVHIDYLKIQYKLKQEMLNELVQNIRY